MNRMEQVKDEEGDTGDILNYFLVVLLFCTPMSLNK